jgi:hypothetical protein
VSIVGRRQSFERRLCSNGPRQKSAIMLNVGRRIITFLRPYRQPVPLRPMNVVASNFGSPNFEIAIPPIINSLPLHSPFALPRVG